MPKTTITIGLLLILLAVGGWAAAGFAPEAKTALIPAAAGIPLLICGLIALKEAARKHAAHAAVIFSLLGALAPIMPIQKHIRLAVESSDDFNATALVSGLAMSVLCIIHVGLSVKSFIEARKARKAAEASEPAAQS